MISITNQFQYIYEAKQKNKLESLTSTPDVKQLISIIKRNFNNIKNNRPIASDDQTELKTLFDKPSVRQFLKAAEKVGRRDGRIKGLLVGLPVGAIIGGMHSIVLCLIGMILVGGMSSITYGEIKAILSRWKAETNLTTSVNTIQHNI